MTDDVRPWHVSTEPSLLGYSVEWVDEEQYILARRNRLYRCVNLYGLLEPWIEFPCARHLQLAAQSRLLQRLLRAMFYNVLALPDGRYFLTFNQSMGLVAQGRFTHVRGCVRPCRVLRCACAVDHNGDVFFGEYIPNTERGVVLVYRLPFGSERIEVAYSFAAGEVRHVHGIYFDPYAKSLWCLTGDREHECKMLATDNGFRTVYVVGGGDETWRAVSVLPTERAYYYATDAEFSSNAIYEIDRSSGSRTKRAITSGPAYYSKAIGKELFFAVSAELCPSQHDRNATIWHLSLSEGTCKSLLSMRKDRLPIKYFLPGTIHFARGPGRADEILFQAVALEGVDSSIFRICREPSAAPISYTGQSSLVSSPNDEAGVNPSL